MIDFVVARGKTVLYLFGAVVLVSGVGLFRLSIDPNNRVFFSPEHAKFAELLRLEAMFGSNTEILFLVSARDDLSVSEDLVGAVRWLSKRVWDIEAVESVESLATHPFIIADGDDFSVEDSLTFACGDAGPCDPVRLEAISAPYLKNRLISSDLTALAVVARVALHDEKSASVLAIAEHSRSLKEELLARYPELQVFVTGGVPMMEAFFLAASRDSAVLLPVVFLVLFVLLAFFLRSVVVALYLAVVGLSAVIITLGLAGWAGHTLNTATAMAPLVIFTLVIACAMHLFMHVVVDSGLGKHEGFAGSIKAAVRSNLVPILLTAGTTSVGFLSMMFVSAPPLRQLGFLAAAGVGVGALLTLTVAPAAFALTPSVLRRGDVYFLQSALNRYAMWTERSRPSAWVAVILLCVGLLGAFRIDFDEDFVRYFSEDTSFRKDTESISAVMAGPYHLDVIYDSKETGGVFSSESIRGLFELESSLRRDPRVVNVASIVDVLGKISHAFEPDSNVLEATSETLAQYFLLYELSLERGQTTLDFVDSGQRYARVSVLLEDLSMANIRDLVEATELWGAENLGPGRIVVSGEGVPTAYLSGESISEMSHGIVVSMIVSAALIGLFLRRAFLVGVVLSASLFPLVAGFGLWGWINGEIGMAATLVIATTIGVVIDDTIHLAYRYLQGRQSLELDSWGAAAYSIHKTGPALVATTVGLSLGFLVLWLSQFEMNRTFGVCSTLVVAIALVYNLTVSPRMLALIR